MRDLDADLAVVQSRADLSEFIDRLREDLISSPESWENVSLEKYLDAMAAWVRDMDGYMENQGRPILENPDWRLMAEILRAAAIYE